MVKVNGVSPRADICKVCGAKLRRVNGESVCPNADRRDHKGEYYNGRA